MARVRHAAMSAVRPLLGSERRVVNRSPYLLTPPRELGMLRDDPGS